MAADELDELLEVKFGLNRHDLVAALRTMLATRLKSAELPEREATLLDAAELTEDAEVYAHTSTSAVAHTGVLLKSSLSAEVTASVLGIETSQVSQLIAQGRLWAIDMDGRPLIPAMQFEGDPQIGRMRQIRSLDQVLRSLPSDLHPVAVAGFLNTSHPNLMLDDRPLTPLAWLRHGGAVASVLEVVAQRNWSS